MGINLNVKLNSVVFFKPCDPDHLFPGPPKCNPPHSHCLFSAAPFHVFVATIKSVPAYYQPS